MILIHKNKNKIHAPIYIIAINFNNIFKLKIKKYCKIFKHENCSTGILSDIAGPIRRCINIIDVLNLTVKSFRTHFMSLFAFDANCLKYLI